VPSRLLIGLVTLMLILPAATAVARPEWAEYLGVDVWNLPDLREELTEANELKTELEFQNAAILDRINMKDRLISDLIAGRRTLAETTSQFCALNQDFPEFLTILRLNYPGATDEERSAWNVMDFVHPRLFHLSAFERFKVLARLNLEMEQISPHSTEAELN
jgi:hypothetical protein